MQNKTKIIYKQNIVRKNHKMKKGEMCGNLGNPFFDGQFIL